MNASLRHSVTMLATIALSALAACPSPEEETSNVEQDVRGVYAPVFHETFVIKLYVGDTVRAAKPSEYAGYVEFGTLNGEQLLLNLGEFCGREEVVCPPELLGEEVVVDQADFDVRLGSHGLMVYPDPTSSGPEKYEGVVDHNAYDQFLLDASNLGGEGICQTLSDSQIDGRFTHTYEEEVDGVVTWKAGEKVDGIGSGLAKVFFRGSCAFGALGADFNMSIEHAFIAYRIGDADASSLPETPDEDVSGEDTHSGADDTVTNDVPVDGGSPSMDGDVSF
jgi:hypothetical protein